MLHRTQIQFTKPPTGFSIQAGHHLPGATAAAVPTEEELRADREQQVIEQNETIKETLASLQFAMEEFEQRRQQSMRELQQLSVELAVMAASHVVQTELQQENVGIEKLVASMIKQSGVLQTATVRLNPADLQLLRSELKNKSAAWDEQLVTLRDDASIERGGVRLDTESGRIVVSDVVTRLSQIRDEWMENIDDTQIESRSVSDDAQSMRRFPDRRETA